MVIPRADREKGVYKVVAATRDVRHLKGKIVTFDKAAAKLPALELLA